MAAAAGVEACAREAADGGMWVAVDADNDAALTTYASVGAKRDGGPSVVLGWTFGR